MSISAMKQAYAVPLIEQLESVPADARMMYEHDKSHHENIPVGRLCHEAAAALRQAIAEAEKQEPVAWREVAGKTTHYYDYNEQGRGEPLYAAPVHASDISQERVDETAKRGHEWVGLTYEEIEEIYEEYGECRKYGYEEAIQDKLKEKNT